MKQQRRTAIQNQRGAALAYVGIGFLALAGFAAVAIDTAHVSLTANEVQIAADVAATSGAINLFRSPITTSGNSAARQGANQLLAENAIDGKVASDWEVQVNVGTYPTGQCNANAGGTGGSLSGQNAVTAQVTAEVPNLLGGIFGDGFRTSRITRTATAAFQPSTGPADLNVSVCSGVFNQFCYHEDCLPQNELQIQSPSTAWTGFLKEATPENVAEFLNDRCQGRIDSESIALEQRITLNNRFPPEQMQAILDAIRCLVGDGLGVTEFTAPVVLCPRGRMIEYDQVVGFMTVVIDQITETGISIHPVFNINAPGPDAGCNYARGYVKLVK